MIYEYECACDAPCPAACRAVIYSRFGYNAHAMALFKLLISKCNETPPALRVISRRELDLKSINIMAFMLMFEHTKVKPEQLSQVYINLKTLMSMTEQFKLFLPQDTSVLGLSVEAVIEGLEKLIEVIVCNLEQLLITNPKYYYT